MKRPPILAKDFRGPNHLMNCLQSGAYQLPVWVKVGKSAFKVTKENVSAIAMGVMLATDEAWDEIKARVDEELFAESDNQSQNGHKNGGMK